MPPARRRRRKVAVTLIVLAVAGGAGAYAYTRLDPARNAAARPSALPPNTAEVGRQTLRETETADGELGYGPTTQLVNRLHGTLTAVPETDDRITRGEPLYRVDDDPVTLMYGSMPAYRTLRDGSEGNDVEQLERNLGELGYTGFTVDEEYTAGTAAAVERWQDDKGLPETGVVELGQVVFASGAVRVDGVEAAEGGTATPGKPVLTFTGTDKAVTVELEASERRMAEEGAKVEVTLPDDTDLKGEINEVATVIEPASGQGEEPTTKVEVVVEIDDQKAAEPYALASVDVTFTADERKDVLVVPVAALVALPEGFGVEVVEGGRTRYVPVETGLFADGRVEVEGGGLTEGTVVGMPK
ncbi:MAG: HlyD family efflux transporter periplasmic adaptor subunit [Streptosporangiales bacterium]|nr:HlyD family efflux transporter periplasmic adaptor subunit [Streptosporangiales bacterium]